MRWLHSALPPLQPLVLALKELLRRHELKSTFTGGLSSYALTVMVSHFLANHAKLNPGARSHSMWSVAATRRRVVVTLV